MAWAASDAGQRLQLADVSTRRDENRGVNRGRVEANELSPVHALLAFCVAAGLLTIVPGMDTALVLRTSVLEGRREAMLAGTGICVGCLMWGLATALAVGALVHTSQFAYHVLRSLGASYLMLLGAQLFVRSWRLSPAEERVADDSQAKLAREGRQPHWFWRGFLTNALNPKVGLFHVTFLPQFVPDGVPVTVFTMLLAAIHATEGVLWFCVLTFTTE
ncbi:MAG TPA: LysE family translocator, partial [Vicinamibacterales bacterium]|nr:LysE family translocator [Vicinamibacterales bacterium]